MRFQGMSFVKAVLNAVLFGLLVTGGSVFADPSYSTGFETSEGYTVGETLYQQDGWTGGDWSGTTWNKISPDEAVVDNVARSGSNSWYFAGGPTTEGAGTPFSPELGASVGAPAHADFNAMSTTLWIKPANTSGDGSALNIYQAATDRSDRTGWNVYVDTDAHGMHVGTYRWSDDTYVWEQIAEDLALDEWHSLDVEAVFKDDFLTDEITYTIDKGTVDAIVSTTGNTWTHPWFDEYPDTYKPGDGLKFAWSRAAPGSADGFYFDDISYTYSTHEEVIPEPTSALVWTMIGLVGLVAGFRRPRRAMA